MEFSLLILRKPSILLIMKYYLESLVSNGVDSISLKWFQSHLTDRKQRTYVNGSLSDYGSTVCGVPQGSIPWTLIILDSYK